MSTKDDAETNQVQQTPRSATYCRIKLLQAKKKLYLRYVDDTLTEAKKAGQAPKSLSNFKVKYQSVEAIIPELKSVFDDLETLSYENTDVESPMDEYMQFLDCYALIKHVYQKQVVRPHSSATSDIQEIAPPKLKLPPIEIPAFNGDPSQWKLFHESFSTLIHKNADLSPVQKVQYLVSKLQGKAASVCAGIDCIGGNYLIIWNALVAKYEDPRLLATTYLNKLLNFKVGKLESADVLNQFVDNFCSTVDALKNLKLDDLEDFIVLNIALSKLPAETVKVFEMNATSKIPSFKELTTFVKSHAKVLERCTPGKSVSTPPPVTSKTKVSHTFFVQEASSSTEKDSCCCCDRENHMLYRCSKFLSLSPRDRYDVLKHYQRCLNCLSAKHEAKNCTSQLSCSKCQGLHHSLLHFGDTPRDDRPKFGNGGKTFRQGRRRKGPSPFKNRSTNGSLLESIVQIPPVPPHKNDACSSTLVNSSPSKKDSTSCPIKPTDTSAVSSGNVVVCSAISGDSTVLLSTVQIRVADKNGVDHVGRFLLDSGSQSNFVTENFCKKVGLTVQHHRSTIISGLGYSTRPVLGKVDMVIQSIHDRDVKYPVEALVVSNITDKLPAAAVCPEKFHHLHNLKLADSSFGIPGEVHGLIGASLYPYLLLPGQCKSEETAAIALNSTLGYIIVGEAALNNTSSGRLFCGFLENRSLENMVQRFWENEELPCQTFLSQEEKEAEKNFVATHFFDKSQSRYCVRLPFNTDPSALGSSYDIAKRRFLALEKKLERSPSLKLHYKNGIDELLSSQHLKLLADHSKDGYFVPHHMIVKESSLTTKHRIVFDFSCKSNNGISLNDILHSGATLYNNLFEILLQFRLFSVAIVADITKMFLQILLHPADHQYQKIFWRSSPDQPLNIYAFTRVVFGSKSSPFLAQRVIRQLASDRLEEFPLVKSIIDSAFYMDDLTASLPNVELALEVQRQLIDCFKLASFELVKWSSNKQELVAKIPQSSCLSSLTNWNPDDSMKILGMYWSNVSDEFFFGVNVEGSICTKRTVLSNLARIWDPLGLISPVTVYCKFLLQSLWRLNLSWDQPAPNDVTQLWSLILQELKLLGKIKVPRHISVFDDCRFSLVGFCDASERACAAVIYTRAESRDGNVAVNLLCSKSKIAPLKKLSIPRLELNAALLLARLLALVLKQYSSRHPVEDVICLSDSTIALHWLHASPHRWQTYVANRVTKIQELIEPSHWYHVMTENNASADCLSRGLLPSQLMEHPTWFFGPPYLQEPRQAWPISALNSPVPDLPEQKTVVLVAVPMQTHLLLKIAARYSAWNRVLRILVYIFRFLKRLPRRASIELSDLDFVETRLWLAVQNNYFAGDLKSFSKFTPFVDDQGIIRVGGRLKNSTLPYNSKHPILLPKNEHVVKLLIKHLHERNHHTGPSLLLSILRQKYWILAARSTVRKITQTCNFCFRFQPRNRHPLMGELPKYRVEEVKPFAITGCDFAGPYQITLSKHRGVKSQKSYLCLFICLATKAIHLEIVSDLSTESFLNALKRFLSRRGPISKIISDNGSNFIGAKNVLNEIYMLMDSPEFKTNFSQELLEYRIEWKTMPANAPHMCGIWERAVRSCKSHISKIIGEQVLTFEELSTVFAQVEALLNSRPLCVLSSDPNELEALTPAHFLKLTPLHHLPAVDVTVIQPNRLTRFKLLDQILQSFWKRWRLEYLNSLQERSKWKQNSAPNICVGDVVLVKDDNAAPLQWPLGIVIEVFPSKTDNIVRVANVKTKTGVFKRPVVKLCPLPTQ